MQLRIVKNVFSQRYFSELTDGWLAQYRIYYSYWLWVEEMRWNWRYMNTNKLQSKWRQSYWNVGLYSRAFWYDHWYGELKRKTSIEGTKLRNGIFWQNCNTFMEKCPHSFCIILQILTKEMTWIKCQSRRDFICYLQIGHNFTQSLPKEPRLCDVHHQTGRQADDSDQDVSEGEIHYEIVGHSTHVAVLPHCKTNWEKMHIKDHLNTYLTHKVVPVQQAAPPHTHTPNVRCIWTRIK